MKNTADTSKSFEKEVQELFEIGAHLGHKKNRLHPKAKSYIYKIINGISIIDLTKTVNNLTQAKKFLNETAKQQKIMLVVATKKIVNQYATEICKNNNLPYITTKWLPGLLTNFSAIIKNVKHLQELKDQKERGEWDKFVKHERIKLDKDLLKLEKFYGGLLDLNKKPDVLLIIDSKKERNALIEAQKNLIPVVGIIDTNSDPNQIDFSILINDDSPSVLQRILSELVSAYVKGRESVS
ncbi:MAG: 30S ribosomal protein S2 [Candidatus Roizmanbacteria bacterium]|nr:MAG: 30S ribosomal protein S2 [Candidatus Roizmanbacteria bacterium]